MKKIFKKEKGFTLIELLVVISIIGILAALATVSFTSAQKQTRDTKRKSDLKQFQNQLEYFANQNNGFYISYPSKIGMDSWAYFCSGIGLESTCPQDPKYQSDQNYSYYYMSNGTSGNIDATQYVLWSKLENPTGYWWVVCSNGAVFSTNSQPSLSSCP